MAPIGVQIPRNARVTTDSTVIKSSLNAAHTVQLTVTLTIENASEVSAEPTNAAWGYMRIAGATKEIQTTAGAANVANLYYDGTNLRLQLDMGISGKIGGAGTEEAALLDKLLRLILETSCK